MVVASHIHTDSSHSRDSGTDRRPYIGVELGKHRRPPHSNTPGILFLQILPLDTLDGTASEAEGDNVVTSCLLRPRPHQVLLCQGCQGLGRGQAPESRCRCSSQRLCQVPGSPSDTLARQDTPRHYSHTDTLDTRHQQALSCIPQHRRRLDTRRVGDHSHRRGTRPDPTPGTPRDTWAAEDTPREDRNTRGSRPPHVALGTLPRTPEGQWDSPAVPRCHTHRRHTTHRSVGWTGTQQDTHDIL